MVLYGACFVLSMIPIVMVAPYVRATGDDLNYSFGVHQTILAGGGVADVWRSVAATVRGAWYSWQGTWSSVALFSLQPGLWGDAWYPLTIAVALVCVLGGTWYFLQVVGRMRGIVTTVRWGICFLTGIVMIQYMPNMKCGIFWWTSVAHYCIPYGIALMCMGWSLRWLESGCRWFLCGMLIGMIYLGGAGYPEVVLVAVWFFMAPLLALLREKLAADRPADAEQKDAVVCGGNDGRHVRVKRALMLWLPLALEMVGFAFSAIAPGNKNRGGESFGFSVSKVLWTLAACVREGVAGIVHYCVQVRILLPVLGLIALLLLIHCGEIRVRDMGANWIEWGTVGAFALALTCLVRTPVLYAGTDASGGVPDSYWFITLTAMVTWLEVFFTPDRGVERVCKVQERAESVVVPCAGLTVGLVLLLLIFAKHFIGGSVDYICVQFIRSGALADYHEQMEEWLTILNDPDVTDAVLPEMNDEQGPFMLMVPLDDPEAWSSQVYAAYYGKQSVVCVPRS